MVSLKLSFRTMPSNILSVIMTITSLKPMCHLQIHLLKKILRSMTILTKCVSLQHVLYLERRDAIIVASVSAIYGLGDPNAYMSMLLHMVQGDRVAS